MNRVKIFKRKKMSFDLVESCPTCMKPIKEGDTVTIDLRMNVVRHAFCAELRPEQVRAIKELKNAVNSIKIRGL